MIDAQVIDKCNVVSAHAPERRLAIESLQSARLSLSTEANGFLHRNNEWGDMRLPHRFLELFLTNC